MDTFSKEKRSSIMRNIRGKNTTPERLFRSALHRAGFRFRLHRKDLPGSPDIVLSKYKTIIFIHGCFWHGHADCKKATLPKTNTDFWQNKLEKNRARDARAVSDLENAGWHVRIIWQCRLRRELSPVIAELSDLLKSYSTVRES
jgi:DNA mismatch endonuclease (patch repair protein)